MDSRAARFAFVIPVFDHAQAAVAVVEQARSLGHPVFVVDDGSRDGGGEALAGVSGITLLRHPENRGKGAALRTGFAAAARVADWAITVDADGQHDPRQAPELIAAIPPDARPIVVGTRTGMEPSNTPWKSRFGRKFSNFWVRASGGHHVADSQSGFRIYPLPETLDLGAKARRFQFEVEVLILARWKGIPAAEAPIRVTYSPPGGRVSHYRPFVDFWRNTAVFGGLVLRRWFVPRAIRRGAMGKRSLPVHADSSRPRPADAGPGRHGQAELAHATHGDPARPERPRRAGIRWWLLVLVAALVAGAAWLGQHRLTIQTDIASSIPVGDPVLEAAGNVLARHPALERIAVDVSFADGRADADGLVALAERIAARLRSSGLFDSVGMARTGDAMAGLFADLPDRLPTLFTSQELARDVEPRLARAKVADALRRRLDELLQLQGVGQAAAIAKDPLGLRDLVLARLGALLPASDARIYRNELLAADNRHLLLLVHPKAATTDPESARRLRTLFADVRREVAAAHPGSAPASLTIVGGFRAALDNEETIRADTQRALLIATLGIALLLVVCFPRPLLGLLALVPATAGVALALLVYSLFRPDISALALGFGGALVSITVDQGIAYLLFLDRTRATRGAEAAHEIWSVGLFATLTTVAAFFALHFSGYPLLEELGLFAGLSVALAFLFIHTVFPAIFPELPAARRPALLPLERALGRMTMKRGWLAAGLAVLAAAGLLAAGFPDFSVDIARMNHVSQATLDAERRVQETWGNVFERVYVALEAPTVAQLQRKTDRLALFLDEQKARGAVSSSFAPSELLPGPGRMEENLAAWRAFWTKQRRDDLRRALDDAGTPLGFTADAFAPFLAMLERPAATSTPIPDELHDLLGVARARDGKDWIWLGAIVPGTRYEAGAVFDAAASAGVRLFDPRLFARRLGGHLGDAFRSMLVIIGLSVVVLVAILFFEPRVVLLALLPLACALAATLGAMNLLGRPIDIPALLLAVVVFGMGIDYSLYFVHTSQRLLDEGHPSYGPMRMTVFLAAGSTVLGMASLAVAEHPVLRSIGVVGTLGVAFAALGAFLLLPPVLRRWYPGPEAREWRSSPDPRRTVSRRYRLLSPHARLFTWFKLRVDRMLPRLAELLESPRTILDVGCGQGVPGAWLLARFPDARVFGAEPDPQRARIAGRVFGPRGSVVCAGAPGLPREPERCDTALLLDVVHQLRDDDLRATLHDLHGRLAPAGRLVLRTTVPGAGLAPWARRLEAFRLRRARRPCRFRSRGELTAALEEAGFAVDLVEPVAAGHEVTWFVAVAGRAEAGSA